MFRWAERGNLNNVMERHVLKFKTQIEVKRCNRAVWIVSPEVWIVRPEV
jgi:hypothetical protein